MLSHSFLGYDTVGGSYESLAQFKVIAKKITVAEDGLLTSIDVHLKGNSANVGSIGCAVFEDVSGTPGVMLHAAQGWQDMYYFSTTARWYSQPVSMWLPAGDYWIAISTEDDTAAAQQIAYDGSGSDRYYNPGAGWTADWGVYSPTTSSNKYSIRASMVYGPSGTKISELPALTALAGDEQFVVNDGSVSKRITAAKVGGSDPVFDLFGTPDTAFEFGTSSLAGLTALSTTPDVEDADTTVPGHYFVKDDNGANNKVVGRYVAKTVPFTVITERVHNMHSVNCGSGVFVGVGTPGALEIAGFYNSPTGGQGTRYILVIRYSNPTTYSSVPFTFVDHGEGPRWFAIRANSSTNVDYLCSYNGRVWIPVLMARNPGITVASAGVAMDVAAGVAESAAFDYLRIWNSALTFPGVP